MNNHSSSTIKIDPTLLASLLDELKPQTDQLAELMNTKGLMACEVAIHDIVNLLAAQLVDRVSKQVKEPVQDDLIEVEKKTSNTKA